MKSGFSLKKPRKPQKPYPELVRKWKARNPDKHRELNRKTYAGKITVQIRKESYEKIKAMRDEYFIGASICDVLSALIDELEETEIYDATKGTLK